MPLVSAVQRRSHQQLAAWLASQHPDLFNALANLAIQQASPTRAQIAGLSGLGGLGDDLTFSDISFDESLVPMPNTSALDDVWTPGDPGITNPVDTSSFTAFGPSNSSYGSGSDLAFAPIGVDDSNIPMPTGNYGPADSGSVDSGGFFSGIGNAVSSVGNFLTSKTGLTAMAGLATAVITSQSQGAILQAQVQRAQAGAAPAPIQYVRDANGNLVPAYVNPVTGQLTPVTSGNLSALTTAGTQLTSTLSSLLPIILLGGGALLVLSLFMNRSRSAPAPAGGSSFAPRRAHKAR